MFFTPYFPAVFFATAFGGFRIGIATALVGGLLGVALNFSDASTDFARIRAARDLSGGMRPDDMGRRALPVGRRASAGDLQAPDQEEEYRKLVVDELQHRLKNKLSTVHAVLHQVLQDQPQVWATIDQRMRALSATDDLIAKVDGRGCDIKDLLLSELGPYGHVRFTLNGDPLFLPAKLAVSLALIFHELATNAGKYGAFSSARGLLQVSWSMTDDRLNIIWDETEGPAVGPVGASRIWHQTAEIGAAAVRRQDRDCLFEDRHSLHDAMPRPGGDEPICSQTRSSQLKRASRHADRVDTLLMTIDATPIQTQRS